MAAAITTLSLLLCCCHAANGQPDLEQYSFQLFTRGINYTANLLEVTANDEKEERFATFTFNGEVYFREVVKKQDTVYIATEVFVSQYEIRGSSSASANDSSGITEPFFARIVDGKIDRFWFHVNTSASACYSLGLLMSYFQQSPLITTDDTLTTIEDDPNGHCQVQYTFRHNTNQGDSVVKQKKQYVQYDTENEFTELKTTYDVSGLIHLLLIPASALPQQVSGTDKIITRLSEKIIGSSETSILIKKTGIPVIPAVTRQLPVSLDTGMNFKPGQLYTFKSSKTFRSEIRKQLLGDDDLTTLVSKLHTPFAIVYPDSMVLKVKSLATVYPAMAYSLAAILDTARVHSNTYKILTQALLDAETEQASNALGALIWKHRHNWSYIKNILTNLGLNPQVTDSVITNYKWLALDQPASTTSRAAWMALGSMMDNLSKRNSFAAQRLWRWISDSLALLDGLEDANRIRLLVWGNSNQPAAFDSVIQYTNNPVEETRSIAMIAAGQFTDSRKIPVLLEAIRTDTINNIRSIAARALSGLLHTKEDLLSIKVILATEQDSLMQQALINTIDIKTQHKELVHQLLQQNQKNNFISVQAQAADLLRRMDQIE